MQMMLILVLGNVLALTPLFQKLTKLITTRIHSQTSAIIVTAVFSILLSYFNWGLGLIFSALLARSIAENANKSNFKLNYPLLVASAYTGMMVWHGGLSGSAPLKVAESGHFLMKQIGIIPVSSTIFSSMNITMFFAFIIIIPASLFLISKYCKRNSKDSSNLPTQKKIPKTTKNKQLLGIIFGVFLALSAVYQLINSGLAALNINLINLILFSLCLLLYTNLDQFTKAVNSSIVNATGIMIQFPIYAGIMGLLKYSGLISIFTDSLISVSTPDSLPLYGFFSAAVVNFFVPSGGGQWAVQGPILVNAAQEMGVSIPKMIMALAYGDQITNMIQPFWAIPLLSITGIKAKQILPYTSFLMIIGIIISVTMILLYS
jgi:short-chain fatty acids transporter